MQTSRNRDNRRPRARGNVIVLVTAALALLVLIAAGFLTRTRSGRLTGLAHRDVRLADNNAALIADMIADEIAQSLFVREIDWGTLPCAVNAINQWNPTCTAKSYTPRLAPRPNALRYGIDSTDQLNLALNDFSGDGIPDFPYNFAPYHVVPWTNWPDATGNPLIDRLLPPGDGNIPTGAFLLPLAVQTEGNPTGNPGFGDHRWLADAEPMRWDINGDGLGDRYAQWRKLTNLARAGNGWRICRDISNLFVDLDDDGIAERANVVADLTVPVEQWLPVIPDTVVAGFEDTQFPDNPQNPVNFQFRWGLGASGIGWLPAPNLPDETALLGYLSRYADPVGVPANFYRLSDTDGDGLWLENGERFRDAFRRGTVRWNVSRVLADADGDGYTDSYWHLVPSQTERGIRQIVAVRIVDNGAMLNFNAASRFVRRDCDVDFDLCPPSVSPFRKTRGHTPADLALAGDLSDSEYFCGFDLLCNLRVGLLDNPFNWEDFLGFGAGNNPNPFFPTGYDPFGDVYVRWRRGQWGAHLAAVGWLDYLERLNLYDPASDSPDDVMGFASERLLYWQKAGRRPFDPDLGLTPYTFGDELELRMFASNNHSEIHSRFEAAVQDMVLSGNEDIGNNLPDNDWDLLHSHSFERRETNEALDQLRNRELLFDLRGKLTAYNGARNDTLPPWLWWRWRTPPGAFPPTVLYPPGVDAGNTVQTRNFNEQARRKLDLREPPRSLVDVAPEIALEPGELYFDQRLAPVILHALTDGTQYDGAGFFGNSYYGPYNTNPNTADPEDHERFVDTRRLAAGFAANILAYRDVDSETYLDLDQEDAVALPVAHDVPQNSMERFVGLELQPFLVKAVVAHVYEMHDAGFFHPAGPLPDQPEVNPGDRVMCDGAEQTTIVVVQIANPFDRPITLRDPVTDEGFELVVFGDAADPSQQRLKLGQFDLDGDGNGDPLQPGESRTYYAMDDSGTVIQRDRWKTLLHIDENDPDDLPPPDFDMQNTWIDLLSYTGQPGISGAWSTSRSIYDVASEDRAVELIRTMRHDANTAAPLARVVVDRVDVRPGIDEPTDPGYEKFGEAVGGFGTLEAGLANLDPCSDDTPAGLPWTVWKEDDFNSNTSEDATHWVQIATASRAWADDIDADGIFEANEENPRFVFADRHVDFAAKVLLDENGLVEEWFNDPGAPVAEHAFVADVSRRAEMIPEIGDDFEFPMQMIQKDGEFEQVGELRNVWLFGHELEFTPTGAYFQTLSTFSEFMREDQNDGRANRIRPGEIVGQVEQTLVGPLLRTSQHDPNHMVPALPAGSRLLDAFACDGRGDLLDFDGDGILGTSDKEDVATWRASSFDNANGFSGALTPGLVNLNTASRQVLQALPHWYRIIHETYSPLDSPHFVHVPDAVIRYRDRLGLPWQTPAEDPGPDYADRGRRIATQLLPLLETDGHFPGMRTERGLASIGELSLLTVPGRAGKRKQLLSTDPDAVEYDPTITDPFTIQGNIFFNSSYQIDFPVLREREVFESQASTPSLPPGTFLYLDDPVAFTPASARVSTDVVSGFDPDPVNPQPTGLPDSVSEDAEEANLLLAGATNMVTTRSDVFTVYFRIRSFRADPVTGAWDATDPENIIEETRYVMAVDRSRVDRPSDKPRILYIEKLRP